MAKHEYGARKQAILAIIKARPGISSTDVRTAYDAQTGKDSGKSTVSSSLTELHGAGDVRREKVLSDNCGYFYRYWLTTSPVAAAPVPTAVQAGKPVHTKPFNLEHARAGAPFCCRDGGEVEILKWDRKHTFCIVGLDTHDASVRRWRADGSYNEGSNVFDLVMLPLGFIDGKPVFAGDEIETKSFSASGAWEPVKVCPGDHGFTTCRWPAPAPVYPETLLSEEKLAAAAGTGMWVPDSALRALSNAVLRHAIDEGQVVLADVSAASVREAYSVGKAVAYKHEAGGRAARDMAIALAVQNACVDRCEPIAGRAQLMRAIGDIDLSAIIAGVTK